MRAFFCHSYIIAGAAIVLLVEPPRVGVRAQRRQQAAATSGAVRRTSTSTSAGTSTADQPLSSLASLEQEIAYYLRESQANGATGAAASFTASSTSATKSDSLPSSTTSSTSVTTSTSATTNKSKKLNVLIITTDQHRYDAVTFIQQQMPVYNGKLKIRTPNLDRLASEGAWFTHAYAQSSSCAPSRATLRTGCTIERHGIDGNDVVMGWMNDKLINPRVDAAVTYDQAVATAGYQAENYGKFHAPSRWFYLDDAMTKKAITYDAYSSDLTHPRFTGEILDDDDYMAKLAYWTAHDNYTKVYKPGMQENVRTRWPYTPIRLDGLYGVNTSKPQKQTEPETIGIDSLPTKYSMSTYTGLHGQDAIQRLAANPSKPWLLTVSFENPHPPQVVTEEYASYYLQHQSDILVPPSIHTASDDAAFIHRQAYFKAKGFQNVSDVQQWSAIYYGMVEQVDKWIGVVLDELDHQGVANDTLVIFTSDHGEFLGAHGMEGKEELFEEAVRVPFFMRLPGKIKPGTIVTQPVSVHLNLFATIMDYLGLQHLDQSDGKSLRPLINGTSFNPSYDDTFCVSEVDLEAVPNFMIRKEGWKLVLSEQDHMLFNLANDPFEMNELLQSSRMNVTLSPQTIGKAEHLKCLLLEWLVRNNGGSNGYFSLPKYTYGKNNGDIKEVPNWRAWSAVDQWVSDSQLTFSPPVFVSGKWQSIAWLYVGRTTSGTLTIKNVSLQGTGNKYFNLSDTQGSIGKNGHMRIKVAFASSSKVDPANLKVEIVILSNAKASKQMVTIVPW